MLATESRTARLRTASLLAAMALAVALFFAGTPTALAVTDDEIPGIVQSSPYAGSLNELSDWDDVIPVYVPAGKRLTVNLTGPVGTDFDVLLFPPGSTSIYADEYVDASEMPSTSNEYFVYDVGTKSGTYYIDVWQYDGSGNYLLTWSVTDTPAPEPDDNIPGVPAPASPIEGTLDVETDLDDVYLVELDTGDVINVEMSYTSSNPGADFDLYFYGPGTANVLTDPELAWSARDVGELESLQWTAAVKGDYYIDVTAYDFAGSYTVTYTVTDPDGDIDVAKLGYSPATGSVDATSDPHDVVKVWLDAEQSIDATLSGPGGTNFSARLFAAGATGVATDMPVAATISMSYPETMTYTAATSGYHYLDVHAVEGEGAYSLAWRSEYDTPTITSVDTTATYYDHADIAVNVSDTGGSRLRRLEYAVSVNATSSFGATRTIDLAGAESTSTTCTVSEVGHLYVRWVAVDGQGNESDLVQRDLQVTDNTTVGLTRSVAYPAYGKTSVLTATVKRAGQNTPVAGATVYFRRWTGSTWANVGTAVTNSSGVAAKAFIPYSRSKTIYKALFAGKDGYIAAWSSSSVSVQPKAYLTTPAAPYTVKRGANFTVYGYLKPYHSYGTVRLYKFRSVSGRLVPYGYVNARIYRSGTYPYYNKYVGILKLPYTGTWYVKAYHGDAGHYGLYTGYDRIAVR